MQELIEAIRTATASNATPEQRAIGAQACRTILSALDAEPGKPIVPPAQPVGAASAIPVDQVLDFVIARLRAIAPPDDSGGTKTSPHSAPLGIRPTFVEPSSIRRAPMRKPG